jgi:hypothetical protein
MLSDYVLQSNWLVARKGKSWTGLLIHGGIVGSISLLAVSPYLGEIWLAVLLLTALHTSQDYLKVYLSPRLRMHHFFPYMADQFLHYTAIGLFQLWLGDDRLPNPPGTAEIAFMWTGAAVVIVTRFYDVTWWANWLDMIPYMNRWRGVGYIERLSMLALAASGVWFIAPLCILPRLIWSARIKRPIWQQRRGKLEMGIGVVLCVALGIWLHIVLAQI